MSDLALNSNNAANVRELLQPLVSEHPRTGTENSASSFCKKVANISKSLFLYSGAVAAVASAITNPTIRSALSSAFSKVADALKECGAFVGENIASCAGGAVASGAINVVLGVRTVAINAFKSNLLSKINKANEDNSPTQERANAFNKLKKMYAAAQARGVFQTAIGLTTLTLGAIVLAGVVSNPFGLAALAVVGGVSVLALAGMQIHKYIQDRQIKAEAERFKATLPKDNDDTVTIGFYASSAGSLTSADSASPLSSRDSRSLADADNASPLSSRGSGSVGRGPSNPMSPFSMQAAESGDRSFVNPPPASKGNNLFKSLEDLKSFVLSATRSTPEISDASPRRGHGVGAVVQSSLIEGKLAPIPEVSDESQLGEIQPEIQPLLDSNGSTEGSPSFVEIAKLTRHIYDPEKAEHSNPSAQTDNQFASGSFLAERTQGTVLNRLDSSDQPSNGSQKDSLVAGDIAELRALYGSGSDVNSSQPDREAHSPAKNESRSAASAGFDSWELGSVASGSDPQEVASGGTNAGSSSSTASTPRIGGAIHPKSEGSQTASIQLPSAPTNATVHYFRELPGKPSPFND